MSQNERRILIVEDDPSTPKFLASWLEEAATTKDPSLKIQVTELVRRHYNEFQEWFDAKYRVSKTDENYFHFLILDVMFKAKDGVKQSQGGYDLYQYIKNRGIDCDFDHIVVVSNGHEAATLFAQDRGQVHVIPKNRRRFIELFEKIL